MLIRKSKFRKQDLRKAFDDFYVFVTPRGLKKEHFFFLQLIAKKKNGGYYIQTINLGESEKVTAVLKLFLICY